MGPGGLAVARPVATAIAGVSAAEVSALGIPINKFRQMVKATPYAGVFEPVASAAGKKYGLAQGSGQGRDRFGVLVGPEYQAEDEPIAPISEPSANAIAADADSVEVKVSGQRIEEHAPTNSATGAEVNDDELAQRLTFQESELVAANPALRGQNQQQQPITLEQFHQQHIQPYQQQHIQPYASYVPAAFRYNHAGNWHPELAEQTARYEPLAYFDQRAAYGVVQPQQQYYNPYQPNVLQINPYQFRAHY